MNTKKINAIKKHVGIKKESHIGTPMPWKKFKSCISAKDLVKHEMNTKKIDEMKKKIELIRAEIVRPKELPPELRGKYIDPREKSIN